MKNGLCLPNAGLNARTLVEFAVLAEQSGWAGVCLEDYIMWQGHRDVPTYDPWTLLGAIAVQTEQVLLGIMITPLARRRPWKVAAEAVTLDHLANGRTFLGIGLGDTTTGDLSFSAFGETQDLKQRARMLDEAIEIIVGLWSGKPFSYQGQYYQVKEMTLLPTPLQQPRIPIWVGGGYPNKGPVQRAARWDGSCMYRDKSHFLSVQDIRDFKAMVEDQQGKDRASRYEISVGGAPRYEDWNQQREYMKSVAEAGATWFWEYVPPDTAEAMRAAIARGPLAAAG